MLTIEKYRIQDDFSTQDKSTAKYFGTFEDTAQIDLKDVSGNTATSFRNDFFGLLRYYSVHPALFRFNLYINRLTSANKYNGQRKIKLCNDHDVVTKIKTNFYETPTEI